MDTSYVIAPIDKELIKKELEDCVFLRDTNKGGRKIYLCSYHTAPNIMREIGRLRELSFGALGGGSGTECDIDIYDNCNPEHCYQQLFVYDPVDEEIVGGYRYIMGKDVWVNLDKSLFSATADLFAFSDDFLRRYWPWTMELGRSFVTPDYQPSVNLRKGMYSLDNLWDGLGGLAQVYGKDLKYWFGKITMYPQMDTLAKDMIMYFYQKQFPDNEGLVWPKKGVKITSDYNVLASTFAGKNYKEDYQILLHAVRERGEVVPPLVNAYMNLSSTMKSFGTSVNDHFSNVEETGILVTIDDIYQEKKDRYMNMSEQQVDKVRDILFGNKEK